nr:EpsG family protein [Vibrio breoganii]
MFFIFERDDTYGKIAHKYLWTLFTLLLMILIGFKYRMGPDWHSYVDMYARASESDVGIQDILYINRDVGFAFLNFLAAKYITGDLGLLAVNVFCGVIFISAILKFCNYYKMNKLAVSICLPYLIFVIGIGYQRQALAISLFMLGLVFFFEGKIYKYLFILIIAALFHKTAILLAPLILFNEAKANKLLITLVLLLAMIGIYEVLISNSMDLMVRSYIDRERESRGAWIRIIILIVPAILFFVFNKNYKKVMEVNEFSLTKWFCAAIVCLPLFMSISSTAVDRVSLYFIPVQVIVFCRFIDLFSTNASRYLFTLITYLGFGAFLIVWFSLSNYSWAWIPYRTYEMFYIF